MLILLHATAHAAPTISGTSGTFADGSSMVVSGANFGVKATATPLIFDNFDANDSGRQNTDQIKGKNASHYGTWANESADTIPTYSNTNQRTGSTLSSYNALGSTAEDNHAPMYVDFAGSHQSQVLVSFWLRFSFDADLSGDETGQWQHKIWRIGDGGEVDGQAHFQMLWLNNNAGAGFKPFFEIFHNNVTNPSWPSDDISLDLDNFQQSGTWQHIIVFLDDTGKANIYVNDVRETTDADLTMTTWIEGDSWQRATFGWYLGTETWTGSSPSIATYYDDIYIDNSWQSVWIGNNATWANCTQREIQLPTAWADDEITVTLNRGAFADLSGQYLFVVDASGNVSAGYQLTADSSPGGVAASRAAAYSATGKEAGYSATGKAVSAP